MTEAPSAKFLLKKVEPEYPHAAKAAGVEGDVVFRIIIGSDGRVEEIHLTRGKPLLIEAAAKARFKVAVRNFYAKRQRRGSRDLYHRPISATQQTSVTCRTGPCKILRGVACGYIREIIVVRLRSEPVSVNERNRDFAQLS